MGFDRDQILGKSSALHASRGVRLVWIVMCLFVVVLAGLPGCKKNKSQSPEPPTTPPASTKAKIILAVHPYASSVELARQYAPLLGYLSKAVGEPVGLSVSKTCESHIARVGKDQVDFAMMGPSSYVTMSKQSSAKKLLCCFETCGAPYFQGCIFVRNDNPATSLKDLAGKSFAAASRKSTMSYIAPRYLFHQAGVVFPEAHLEIVNSHSNVCLNVLAGDVNAGAVREKAYERCKARGLKIIAMTPKIREHLFVATHKLDAEMATRIQKALLAIQSPEDVKRLLAPIKASMTGLSPVADADYDPLRAIMNVVQSDVAAETKAPGGDQ